MASSTSAHPYAFQRPSTLATRSLVSDTKPAAIPSASSNDGNNTATSYQDQQQATASPLTSTTSSSNNYAQATATAGGVGLATARLERTQSWKLGDKKREATEQMLASKGPGTGQQLQGYSSTGTS